MNAQDLRNHIAKSVGFGVETPRTVDPNERNETGDVCGRCNKANATRFVMNEFRCDECLEIDDYENGDASNLNRQQSTTAIRETQ